MEPAGGLSQHGWRLGPGFLLGVMGASGGGHVYFVHRKGNMHNNVTWGTREIKCL